MRKAVLFKLAVALALGLGYGLSAGAALAAKKPHVQKISTSLAAGFCKNHGGGTNCSFCDPAHCHVVQCSSKGKCSNAVFPLRAAPKTPVRGKNADAVSPGSKMTRKATAKPTLKEIPVMKKMDRSSPTLRTHSGPQRGKSSR